MAMNALCPRCHQDTFDFEDVGEGERLVCGQCGTVLEEVELVHQSTYNENGQQHRSGTYVAADDDGLRAAALLFNDGSATGLHAITSYSRVASKNKERMDAAMSYLQLPQHVMTAARELLPNVVRSNADQEPRRHMTAATVGATIYLAARLNNYALSLGAVGSALSVYGVDVGREFRRLVGALNIQMPPPSLTALLLRTAAAVLPHYTAGMTGTLRQQPIVRKALNVAELLQLCGAVDGRSPAVGAAAILAMCLSEEFKDAKPTAYAVQVAAVLQHDRSSIQRHIQLYQDQLSRLAVLLPFVSSDPAAAGVEAVRHAGVLLKLRRITQNAEEVQKQRHG